jgi:hypothetical protein
MFVAFCGFLPVPATSISFFNQLALPQSKAGVPSNAHSSNFYTKAEAKANPMSTLGGVLKTELNL